MTNKDKDILERYRKPYPDATDDELLETRRRFQNLVRIALKVGNRLYTEFEESQGNAVGKQKTVPRKPELTDSFTFRYNTAMPRKNSYSEDEILHVIQLWFINHGCAPTVEEIREELGAGSTRTVWRYLGLLEKAGKIERFPGARGIRVLSKSRPTTLTMAVPLIGQVAAGSLTLAEENVETWIDVPKSLLLPGRKHFFLRVRGDSMNQASIAGNIIEDGDLVLVRQQQIAKSNEIVVAEVNGETTVKRLQTASDYAVLMPDSNNPIHRPIIVGEDFHVQGVVVKVFKQAADFLAR